jgi:LPS sulfotransferase NodH
MDNPHPFNAASYDLPFFEGEVRSYVICSAPRCGSTLLSNLLQKCRVMGVPHEYFNVETVVGELCKRWGLPLPVNISTYMETIYQKRTSANGVFGLKAHFSQISGMIGKPSLVDFLYTTGAFIHITREDILAQAVSYAMAHQTRNWSSLQAPLCKPEYDAEMINRAIDDILKQESHWKKFFTLNGISPIEVRYDDLVANSNQVCHYICKAMNVETDYTFDLDQTDIAQQSGELNREWIDRFRKEKRLIEL